MSPEGSNQEPAEAAAESSPAGQPKPARTGHAVNVGRVGVLAVLLGIGTAVGVITAATASADNSAGNSSTASATRSSASDSTSGARTSRRLSSVGSRSAIPSATARSTKSTAPAASAPSLTVTPVTPSSTQATTPTGPTQTPIALPVLALASTKPDSTQRSSLTVPTTPDSAVSAVAPAAGPAPAAATAAPAASLFKLFTNKQQAATTQPLATAAKPLATATTTSSGDVVLEGESLTLNPTGSGSRYSDSTASGGSALLMSSKGTASATVSLPTSSQLVIRAKGDQYNGAPSMTVSLDGKAVATVNVSATSWTDYTVPVTTTAGTHTVSIAFTNDAYAGRGKDRNLRIDKITAIATPVPPSVSITDVAVAEGNSGTTSANFAVSLSKSSTTPVTVGYATADGTATAGTDYTPTSGTLTFAPGVTTQTIAVNILGDTTVEPNETFTLTLSNPTGATLARTTATATITNDDTAPNVVAPVAGDNTASLQAAFDALQPGQTLNLAPGTYQHSGVLTISTPNVTINANGATLQATNDTTSAVKITGNGVSLSNLNLTAPLTGSRYSNLDQNSLDIMADNVTVNNVTVTGSAAAGVFVYGASGFTLTNITVQNTRADGIHMTNGANNGHLDNITTKWTGDDGIAVVSYSADTGPCHDIVINSPTVNGTTWGRGISVVGGNNITYTNINVSATYAAGIYIASEGAPWYTTSVNNVQINGGTVTAANTSTDVVHGAVLIYAGNPATTINNVTISGLTIADTPTTAYRNTGIIVDAGKVSNITLTNITLKNTTLAPLLTSNVPAGSYTTSGWTRNGTPITLT